VIEINSLSFWLAQLFDILLKMAIVTRGAGYFTHENIEPFHQLIAVLHDPVNK